MTNKFNSGDYVEVVAGNGDTPHIGGRGVIVAIDDEFGDWMYVLDIDEDVFYDEHMLKLVEIKKVYQTTTPTNAEHNGEVGEVVYSRPAVYEKPEFTQNPEPQEVACFKVTYYVDKERMKLTGPDGAVIVDDNRRDIQAHNVFLSGFFEGLTYAGVRFEAKVEYVRG